MDEILTILPQAWSGAPLDHDGPMYAVPRVAVRPVPDHPIPIWIGGNADAAISRAARRADGFFSNAPPERFAEQIAVAEQARAEIRRETPFAWAHYAICYVADDPEEGWEEVRDHVRLMTWKYADMEASASRRGPLPAPPPMTAEEEAGLRRRVLVGPAEQIARDVLALRDAVATDFHLVARSYFPGMPFSRQQEQVRRLGEELAPLLRRA
jgi:alkanesulfonate monooxygenase SsuD/methylene tetrahydromethanopterin reductase-like flavin-dependent oxidoreductase (luciferase family)